MTMKPDNALTHDPWQELARDRQVKKVSLNEALQKLQVSLDEAPAIKKQMMSQMTRLVKPVGTKKAGK